jgi:ADP-heptose:LPS heptosyltransferase
MDELVLVSPKQIGDTLLATPAMRAWKRAHPGGRLTVCCADEGGPYQVLLHNPHIDALLAGVDAARLPGTRIALDPEAALKLGYDSIKPFAWSYGRQLGVEVDDTRYDYVVTPAERDEAQALARSLGDGKPIVVVARHSPTCLSNHPAVRRATKCVQNSYWLVCAERLMQRGYVPIAVGAHDEASDPRFQAWPGKRLYGHPLRGVAALCAQAAGVLTIDNGIRHLATAAGANVYALSGWIHLEVIACAAVRDGQRIVEDYVRIEDVTARMLSRGAERLGLL